MLGCSSVKYDTMKTIILKDAHNIDENSTLEHKSPCIHNVCTISSWSTFLQILQDFKSAQNDIKVVNSTFQNYDQKIS